MQEALIFVEKKSWCRKKYSFARFAAWFFMEIFSISIKLTRKIMRDEFCKLCKGV